MRIAMKNKIRVILFPIFMLGMMLTSNAFASDNISVLKVDTLIMEKGNEYYSVTVKVFVKNDGESDDIAIDVVAIDAGGFELAQVTVGGFLKQEQTKVLVAVVKVSKEVYEEIVGWEWKGRFGDLDRYEDRAQSQ
jgi:hypothetical protein